MTDKNKPVSLFQRYKKDFDYCEKIIRKHSTSFYAAFSTLPKEKAMSVYAIYAFCRKADDIVDEDSNVEGLERLREELRLFEAGQEVDHPVWRALRVVFTNYQMDISPFYDMITGQKMDLVFEQPETQRDLEVYSYHVAGSVGLMMLPLLTDEPECIKEEAIALGEAMQITNILRDVGEDLRNSRIYLPKEVMQKFGYTKEMLKSQLRNDTFIALWEFEANQAEKAYSRAIRLLPALHEEAKKPLLLSLLFYREILEAVRANDYQCFTQRNHVSKRRKLQLLQEAEEMLRESSLQLSR